MNKEFLKDRLVQGGLKVTPQRIAILEALYELKGHPTADMIARHIKPSYTNIALGTVYNTLEKFVKNGIIKKVKTDKDIMRYDPVLNHHHHLYCNESERIEDYNDEELNQILENYFTKHKIPHFKIEDVRMQIVGKFTDKK